MNIEIENIGKSFGSFVALKNINLTIPAGKLVALLGPSGSGKTTLLRVIAGLETADQGVVRFDGRDMTDLTPKDRQVGFVFQHYALFRHMNVFENVAFGLKVRPRKVRPSKEEIRFKVEQLLQLVKMENMSTRYPAQLSGGQRQRIALARALAVEPKVLLLDEPFGALDAKVRKELRRWLRKLHDDFPVTSVFVTHDQEEALDVADQIVVMNEGQIEQVGKPEDVYDHPKNPFVYRFLGNVNLFRGRLHRGRLDLGGVQVAAPDYQDAENTTAVGYVRPHELHVERERNGVASLQAKVLHIHAVGPVVYLELQRKDNQEVLEAELSREQFESISIGEGDNVYVRPKDVKVFMNDLYQ